MSHEHYNVASSNERLDGSDSGDKDATETEVRQETETVYSSLLCGDEGPRADKALHNRLRVTDNDEIVRNQQVAEQIISDIDDCIGTNYPTFG